MSKLLEAYEFNKNEEAKKKYEREITQKTRYYYSKYHFKLDTENNKPGFHNDEGDAFRHTFLSADLYLKYGNATSTLGGIKHELEVPNNFNEWNMDSWNNDQGRKVAKEIKDEYGSKLEQMSQQERDDIIAKKIVERIHNGELITNTKDKRLYKGWLEGEFRKHPNTTDKIIKKIKSWTSTEDKEDLPEQKYLTLSKKEFEENLEQYDISHNIPIEKYEKLAASDRVFYEGEPRTDIVKKAKKDITQWDIDELATFFKQQSRNHNKFPTQAELDERVARGELIWVEGYTKQDGTVVRGYFRHYPETV